ncbi:hypothetical protein HYFRA_00004085 [Hymenoscyphus fraxineus]|uniref:Uncharacterized protein n=1 Tax=Hymenoscyphus fraxineus TaxID=746836 RepID=A0A9N9PPT1_9HELO|nr:hypothetical protein HYFRA_00004085 [Hymenoscyphus fraxineus]
MQVQSVTTEIEGYKSKSSQPAQTNSNSTSNSVKSNFQSFSRLPPHQLLLTNHHTIPNQTKINLLNMKSIMNLLTLLLSILAFGMTITASEIHQREVEKRQQTSFNSASASGSIASGILSTVSSVLNGGSATAPATALPSVTGPAGSAISSLSSAVDSATSVLASAGSSVSSALSSASEQASSGASNGASSATNAAGSASSAASSGASRVSSAASSRASSATGSASSSATTSSSSSGATSLSMGGYQSCGAILGVAMVAMVAL